MQGAAGVSQRVLRREEPAAEGLAQKLGLAVGAPVFHTLIVHFEDGLALQRRVDALEVLALQQPLVAAHVPGDVAGIGKAYAPELAAREGEAYPP